MKSILKLLLCLFGTTQFCDAHSIYSKANYYGASHSVLIQITDYEPLPYDPYVSGLETSYRVKAKSLEVFYGDVPPNFEYLYTSPPIYNPKAMGYLKEPVIVSLCKSKSGVFYNYDNFAHIPATEENIGDFRRMSKANASEEDDHTCLSNFPHYNPDNR